MQHSTTQDLHSTSYDSPPLFSRVLTSQDPQPSLTPNADSPTIRTEGTTTGYTDNQDASIMMPQSLGGQPDYYSGIYSSDNEIAQSPFSSPFLSATPFTHQQQQQRQFRMPLNCQSPVETTEQQINVGAFLTHPDLLVDNTRTGLDFEGLSASLSSDQLPPSSLPPSTVDAEALILALTESLEAINAYDQSLPLLSAAPSDCLAPNNAGYHRWNPARLVALFLQNLLPPIHSLSAAANFTARLFHLLPSSFHQDSTQQTTQRPSSASHSSSHWHGHTDHQLLNCNNSVGGNPLVDSSIDGPSAFSPNYRFLTSTSDDFLFASSSSLSTSSTTDRFTLMHNHCNHSTLRKDDLADVDSSEFTQDENTLRAHIETALNGMTETFMASRGGAMVANIMEMVLHELGRLQSTVFSMGSIIGKLTARLERATIGMNEARKELHDVLESKRKLEQWIQSFTQNIRFPVGSPSATPTSHHHHADQKSRRAAMRHSTTDLAGNPLIPRPPLFIPPPPPLPPSSSMNTHTPNVPHPPPPPPPSTRHPHYGSDSLSPSSRGHGLTPRSMRHPDHNSTDSAHYQHYSQNGSHA